MDFEATAKRSGYSIYTTEFDEVRDIRDDRSEAELRFFRDEAEEYKRYGSARPSVYNDSGDAPALDRAISEFRETVTAEALELGIEPSRNLMGFLIDNSGSVRNLRPVYARAMHRVCEVLDDIGFATTVVGHTTVRWKGGESRKKWLEGDRIPSPGRLNDLLITVYKEPDEPMAEGDLRLYGLNMPFENYKENIDGEALAWMAEAMDATEADNRSLIFVSDGDFPCDDSTIWSNSGSYLLDHRNAVIDEINSASGISLVQVVATEAEMKDGVTDLPRYGGSEPKSSDLVRAIGQAVRHALRMKAEPEPAAIPKPRSF